MHRRHSFFRPGLFALEDRFTPAVLSDNLSVVTTTTETATTTRWLTSSFATDAANTSLDSVTLLLANTTAGTAKVSVYTDNNLQPGTLVATLAPPASFSETTAETTFVGSGITLNANTTYWVVLSANSGAFAWSVAADNSGSGAGFKHTYGDSADSGGTWFTFDTFPTQMSVSASGAVAASGKLTAVAAGSGAPTVVVYNAAGTAVRNFAAFDTAFTGGVRVATADVNADGTDDIIVGTGPGIATNVKVFNGVSGVLLTSFAPFEAAFTGGVYVAAGDTDADGKADVVVTPDRGGGPVVAVFSGASLATGTAAQTARFFGIDDANFRGGARPALGDINKDAKADLVVSAGFLGGPRIAVFNGATLASTPQRLVGDFFAFEQGLRNGAFVTVGDVTGDGAADLIFGGGPGGGPRVRVASGAALLANVGGFVSLDDVAATVQTANFFAADAALRGGVRVAADDATGDGTADLLTGSGTGEASRVRVYSGLFLRSGTTPVVDHTVDPFGAALADGVFVG